jgi:Mg-chelatase subunit ChlI
MQRVIMSILTNRLTTLKGIPGIGKSVMSKCIGDFLSDREVFQDGIIFISMHGRDQTT